VSEQNQEIIPLQERDKSYLLKYIEGLDALLSTNYIISSAFELNAVFQVISNQAAQFLEAEACAVFLLTDDRQELHLRYTTASEGVPDNILIQTGGLISQAATRGFPVNLASLEKEGMEEEILNLDSVHSLLCVPLISQEEILGIVLLVNKKGEGGFTREDAQLFESYAGQIGQAIRNFEHIQQELEQQKLEREIEFCAKIQRRILPKAVPEIEGYGISGSTWPCRKVGGDWFNFHKRDNGEVDFVIADVSGKGIAAALVVAMAHSALQVLTKERQDISVEQTIRELNQFICDSIEFGQFITLFYGRLNPSSGRFSYVNAGHDAPFFFEPGAEQPSMLTSTGKILGLDSDAEFSSGEITLEPGSCLIMLTDGFLETTDAEGVFFGDVFLDKIQSRVGSGMVGPLRREIYNQLKSHRGGQELKDDATLLMITRPPE
jgi:sigma-B regulation protein RsbU (phosphoserine phosphatase)